MNPNESFEKGQLPALCTLILLSPALRLYPLASARLAGRGAWLSALAPLPLLLGYLYLLCRFLSARRTGEGLAELLLRVAGKKAGRAVLAAFALWLTVYCGFVLRAGAERFVIGMFPKSSPSVFSLSLGLACLLAAMTGPRAIARTAKMLLPLLIGILLFLLLLSLRVVDLRQLVPLTARDTLPILAGSLPVIDVTALCLYLPALLVGGLPQDAQLLQRGIRWLCGAALLLCALCAAVLGAFGAELTQRLAMPFFTLVRNLSFLRSFERMDALVISLWIFPDFLLASTLLWSAQHCLRLALAPETAQEHGVRTVLTRRRVLFLLCGAAAISLSLLMGRDEASLARLSEQIVPLCNLAVAFLLIPILYIVGRFRRRLP